jgi:hypothetical protein
MGLGTLGSRIRVLRRGSCLLVSGNRRRIILGLVGGCGLLMGSFGVLSGRRIARRNVGGIEPLGAIVMAREFRRDWLARGLGGNPPLSLRSDWLVCVYLGVRDPLVRDRARDRRGQTGDGN